MNSFVSFTVKPLFNEIIKKNPTHTFGELAELDVQKLNLLTNSDSQQLNTIRVIGNASEKAYIGKDDAISKALTHANVEQNEAKSIKVEFDYDDGIMEYEVEFYINNIEYEYEINAITGEILKSNREHQNNTIINDNANTQGLNKIGESVALDRALNHAGLNKSNAYDIKCEFEYKNGKAVYEVEFDTREYEYKYDIDAANGSVIHFEKEWNDYSGCHRGSCACTFLLVQECI